MKILPDSQINNMPILEDVLEELRLNIIDHLQYIADAKYLYSLNSDELKQKLGLLGLTSINIGKFISLDLSQDIFRYISPEFYKMYRKLNQHRGNKMSMDYIFHSAGMMNTLVHSNDQYYNATNIFDDVGSFFDFNTFRDNQFPELEIGDGYIIVPYTSNKVQLLKQYLATNPIIFSFLPAGYTFIFLSDYRNSFDNGALQYDNVLNYLDTQEVVEYLKQLYWEPYNHYTAEEQIIYPNSEEEVTYTHDLYYYDPIYFRDAGYPLFINNYSRFEDDSLYILPYGDDLYTFNTLEEYLAYYTMLLMDSVLTDYEHGLEADLNNPLFYKDVWVGDHLVSYLLGENVESEYPDHVKGLKAIQNPSYSYASLYDRGQSLASQYLQREQGIISKTDVLIQEHKPEIISDRREMDLFKIVYTDEYSLWIIAAYDLSQASLLLQNVMGIDANLADLIVSNIPSLIQNSLDYDMAEFYFNQLVSSLTSNDIIFEVRDNNDSVVLTNASQYNIHTEEITSNNYIPSYLASLNRASIESGSPTTIYTLSFVNTQLPDITITMPQDETGTSGTVVTLPTMTGEYQSGGKTWTPSAWDIGAFGSSYTLNADTVAHLVFEEVPQYEEITLYMASGAKAVQTDITSAFKGDVSSKYVYRLYEDENLTIPWTGYDYSNDYEIWYYYNGTWVRQVDAISAMPDYTTTGTPLRTIGLILMDIGYLWAVSNITGSSYSITTSSITLRVYPKEQQYYAAYFNTSDALANISLSSTTHYLYYTTGNSSALVYGKYIKNNATLVDVVGSAGNSVKISGDKLSTRYVGSSDYLQLSNGSASTTRSARNIIFTLPHKTFIGYFTANQSDSSISSGGLRKLMDENGNEIPYDENKKYTPIEIYSLTSGVYDDSLYDGNYSIGSDDTYPGVLCFKQTYGSISANRTRIVIENVDNYIWAYFTASGGTTGTNTGITSGNSYPLFDSSGNQILYSDSKSYEIIEVQYHTSNGYLLRGTTKFDTFTDNGSGQLQCTAHFTNTQVGVNRIKIWVK